jgi:hypothetical protein
LGEEGGTEGGGEYLVFGLALFGVEFEFGALVVLDFVGFAVYLFGEGL